ncbi:B12-binding domain-containing protein [Polynucleobacter sp. AP-Titi-500A-B4]|uniref:cobalamin B12-binding domain-containing protein n=1 Tax=Polynucleobacter sp. AP-Titi-500A-B4 TaxID=2576923 RepID=UPI001BFE8EB5|nr:cobalamin-dependent protein [Polynucleobacter sp. AP-Titi-500A-B4]QWE12082.1 cobalamin B12-binding domain-containing protein [Polynucleobacter sp. AP-Titi-500A-B4]
MNTLAKKELILEVVSTQLPNLIEEIERKVDDSASRISSNQSWVQTTPQARRDHAPNTLDEEEINRIADLLLNAEEDAFEYAIKTHKAHGVPIDYIVLDLIPEIARKLGKHWEEDSLSFADVSIGVNKLERVIYKLDYLFQANQLERQQNKSIFVSGCPGSQHSLGTLIFANFLTFSGWQVHRPNKVNIDCMVEGVESKNHQALAISVATNEQLEQLPNLISLLRQKSKNPKIIVLIGGPLYNKTPDAFDDIQADIKACSPEESVQKLEQYLSHLDIQVKEKL